MKYFGSMIEKEVFIHTSAVIDEGAQVGAGTRIWHFCHLMPGCRVGKNCIVGQNVFIDNNVLIGNGVKIQNNVSVYNGVVLEDDVFLGPSMVFTNVMNPRSFIERKTEFKPTLVRKGATIGANASILCGVEIGSYAMIGAGTVVVNNVFPYALVVGNPARQIGWVSKAGITLDFRVDGTAVCPATGESYKLISQILVPVQ
jgi:UDP-2-acetamido-3-amino-2,3-dideoxy-glucuronate N-acetyltransferase